MKIYKLLFTAILLFVFVSVSNSQTKSPKQKLIDGYSRFVSSQMIHPNSGDVKRTELAEGQHPFAVIVSCSDSRVPPELIFDQGLGDLFVIRTAGEVVDAIGEASIEYAVEHLGVKLIVVMGHQKCGAVGAAVKGGKLTPNLDKLVAAIAPAVKKAKGETGDLLDNAVRENALMIVNQLKNSKPVLHEFVEKHGLKIVGAYYNLLDGVVTFLQ